MAHDRSIHEAHAGDMTEAELEAAAEFLTACEQEFSPDDPPASADEARSELYQGTAVTRKRRLLATEPDGTVTGLASLVLDLTGGNQHITDLRIRVRPGFRRQGLGTALLRESVRASKAEGRTSMASWGARTEASMAFWDAMGMPEKSRDRMSRALVADVDQALMESWRTNSAAKAKGYRLVGWTGACPEEYLGAYVASLEAMNDAPRGDLEMEHETLDQQWCRAREASLAKRGGLVRALVALSSDDEPAGMTEIIVFGYKPWFVMQQGTATLADHRAQGIGRWLKATMFQQILRHHPEVTVIETGNASSNAPMLSINNAMGFRPHVELTTRQLDMKQLEANLAARP